MSPAGWFSLITLLIPGVSLALGLGEPAGQVVIGQPLSIQIPLQGTDVSTLRENCIRLVPLDNDMFDRSLASATVRIDQTALIVYSSHAITEPILRFAIQLDCGINLRREYQLLPSGPNALPEVRPQRFTPAFAANETVTEPVKPTATELTISSNTTLRLISRERFPRDRRARIAFIRQVAAANPAVFGDIESAFDQPLSSGVRLRMPERFNKRTVSLPVESALRKVQLPISPKPAQRDKGRLVIGAGAPNVLSVRELQRDVDRLVGIMNEQMQIQISMVERTAKLEEDIANAKQAIVLQKEVSQRLASEVADLRHENRWNSYVQLILAILLGAMAVAAILLWRERVLSKVRATSESTFLKPILTPEVAPAQRQPMTSVFDELLDPRRLT